MLENSPKIKLNHLAQINDNILSKINMFSYTEQDESRSISENTSWVIRRRYERGKFTVNETKFLGYDKDEEGNLIINEKQAKIVRRIGQGLINII